MKERVSERVTHTHKHVAFHQAHFIKDTEGDVHVGSEACLIWKPHMVRFP